MPDAKAIRDHVIVDGSNIATEGRSLPSLAQLDEAVRAFLEEYPGVRITAVVDATFAHRIDASEKPQYEQAILDGDLVAPPAGAVGRGDAFVLAIAHKASATILSNDSFQEFHGEYPWVFDEGRLIGGKPVDGVGWVFVIRSPVRGPLSRRSQRGTRSGRGGGGGRGKGSKSDAKAVEAEVQARRSRSGPPAGEGGRTNKAEGEALAADAAAEMADMQTGGASSEPAPGRRSGSRRKAKSDGGQGGRTKGNDGSRGKDSSKAKSDSKDAAGGGSGGRRRSGKAPETINEPGPFVAFVSEHPVGTVVEAVVDRFSSHGAYVAVGEAQCYVPLRSMADPPPRSAREVLTVGESRTFVVDAFDAPRRSIDLAVPGREVTGSSVSTSNPAEEAPDMAPAKKKAATKKAAAKKKAPAKKAAAKRKAPAKKAAAKKKAPAKKAAAKRKAPAKKAPAKRKAPARKAAAKKKAPAKKAAAKKKAPAKKAAAKRKAPAKKAPAKRKAPARKAAARKRG